MCGGNQEQNAEIRFIASMLKIGTQITARFRPELYAALEEPIHKSTVIVSNQEVLDRDIIYIRTYSKATHVEDCLDLSMMFLLLIGSS